MERELDDIRYNNKISDKNINDYRKYDECGKHFLKKTINKSKDNDQKNKNNSIIRDLKFENEKLKKIIIIYELSNKFSSKHNKIIKQSSKYKTIKNKLRSKSRNNNNSKSNKKIYIVTNSNSNESPNNRLLYSMNNSKESHIKYLNTANFCNTHRLMIKIKNNDTPIERKTNKKIVPRNKPSFVKCLKTISKKRNNYIQSSKKLDINKTTIPNITDRSTITTNHIKNAYFKAITDRMLLKKKNKLINKTIIRNNLKNLEIKNNKTDRNYEDFNDKNHISNKIKIKINKNLLMKNNKIMKKKSDKSLLSIQKNLLINKMNFIDHKKSQQSLILETKNMFRNFEYQPTKSFYLSERKNINNKKKRNVNNFNNCNYIYLINTANAGRTANKYTKSEKEFKLYK